VTEVPIDFIAAIAVVARSVDRIVAQLLPARPQVEGVVDHAEGGRQGATEQQPQQVAPIDRLRDGHERCDCIGGEQAHGHDDEGRGDGDAATAWDRRGIDPAVAGQVDGVEVDCEPPDQGGEGERDRSGTQERNQEQGNGGRRGGDEAHARPVSGRSTPPTAGFTGSGRGPGSAR